MPSLAPGLHTPGNPSPQVSIARVACTPKNMPTKPVAMMSQLTPTASAERLARHVARKKATGSMKEMSIVVKAPISATAKPKLGTAVK